MPLSKKRDKERKMLARLEKISVQPKKDKLASLRELIANPEANSSPMKNPSSMILPVYNRRIHKAGDRVHMPGSNIEVIVPELDGDGNQIW